MEEEEEDLVSTEDLRPQPRFSSLPSDLFIDSEPQPQNTLLSFWNREAAKELKLNEKNI